MMLSRLSEVLKKREKSDKRVSFNGVVMKTMPINKYAPEKTCLNAIVADESDAAKVAVFPTGLYCKFKEREPLCFVDVVLKPSGALMVTAKTDVVKAGIYHNLDIIFFSIVTCVHVLLLKLASK